MIIEIILLCQDFWSWVITWQLICVCGQSFSFLFVLFCFSYYCYYVIWHRFEQFWLRLEWQSSEGFKVYGTGGGDPSNLVIRLTYDNWGDPEAFNALAYQFKSFVRFLMTVNTGKWDYDFPNHVFGVICKFGKSFRVVCRSTIVIYYERVFSLVL